jgi:hypothetical protein
VGAGTVRVSQQTLIQVTRPTFGDEDLRRMLELHDAAIRADSTIYTLSLSGTAVTDEGVKLLESVPTIEYCFLFGKGLSNASVDVLEVLPNLRMLQIQSDGVTPERLQQLSIDRPELKIVPTLRQQPTGKSPQKN